MAKNMTQPCENSLHIDEPLHFDNLQMSKCSNGIRRFIPQGHIDHFQTSKDCLCVRPPRRLRILRDGKEHHSVIQRNPIVGILGPRDVHQPPSKRILVGPLGSYLPLSDYCGSQERQETIPTTEQRAQYTSCKPWIARDIYSSTSQANKDNKLHSKSVHPSVNCFLYEDKYTIVR